ncbi:MAG: hypothetical protein HY721_01635 [Planctomycetes bacterium]|nr:hypothetical protein [Planctomycetota bacterium]
MRRFFCYVDETGQDTQGRLFVVAVVVAQSDRAALIRQLEGLERQTGKGNVKWNHTKPAVRRAYIEAFLSAPAFKGTLNYAVYGNTRNYPVKTILTVAQTIGTAANKKPSTWEGTAYPLRAPTHTGSVRLVFEGKLSRLGGAVNPPLTPVPAPATLPRVPGWWWGMVVGAG